MNPVTRIVQLLEGLRTETEEDHKKEEKLFDRYRCWAKTTVSTKEASNKKAKKRMDELATFIDDIKNGRIEFTSERTDLEKELKEIMAAMKEASELDNKEAEDFNSAEEEMEKTLAALDEAISVLGEATEDHKEGVLVQVHRAAAESEAQAGEKMQRIVELAQRVLSKGDALFIQRLVSGDVPKPDWKKLNRKATFKMAYKARSFKIQDIMKKMHQTVSISLADARKNESERKTNHAKLMKAKTAERDACQEALSNADVENGAKGMNIDEAQAEFDALEEQFNNDERFIKQVNGQLKAKTQEWSDRSVLRMGEIDAISKAIEILSNDDAKDLMTRSHKSQGYFFLQEASVERRSNAAAAIRIASNGNARMNLVASMVENAGGHFDKVIEAIDKMVELLKEEEEDDLKKKEQCEKDRADNTRKAAVESRKIDDLSDTITRLNGEIDQINDEIKAAQENHEAVDKELKAAQKNRNEENAEWAKTDADDKLAFETVGKAKGVLQDFYSKNGLMLVQTKFDPSTGAGEAPVEPPKTWDSEYGGKTDQSTSIIAILEMIEQDIQKDRDHAKAAEDKAQASFDEFKAESEAQMGELMATIKTLKENREDKEGDISTADGERNTARGELSAVMQTIKDGRPTCDFFEIQYPMRLKNRQTEIDGLIKAKAILQGATFPGGFLQKK